MGGQVIGGPLHQDRALHLDQRSLDGVDLLGARPSGRGCGSHRLEAGAHGHELSERVGIEQRNGGAAALTDAAPVEHLFGDQRIHRIAHRRAVDPECAGRSAVLARTDEVINRVCYKFRQSGSDGSRRTRLTSPNSETNMRKTT